MAGLMVKTQSGSTYLFDRTKMTWQRQNERPIRWYEDHDAGTLDSFPDPVVGEPMFLDIDGGNWLRTTPVTSVEEVS